MIPILYESTEKDFTSNGIGRLSDAISCTVEENRNGTYELEMKYPVSGNHFKDIQELRIIYAVPADGKDAQPFDIYKITKPLNRQVTIKARHISYRLSKIPTAAKNPDEKSGTAALALMRLKSEAVEDCPFEFWTDNETRGAYTTPEPASIRSRLGGVTGSILDNFGGEYEWDKWTVKLWKKRGIDTNVVLRYGKNITDITQEESIENTVTGVLPFWRKDADSNGAAQLVIGTVQHSENYLKYPYRMTMVLDCSQDYQDAPTAGQLNAKAQTYIKNNDIGIPDVNIKVSFVALWQTEEYKHLAALERIHLCDTLRVEFPSLGVSASAKVIKTIYNVLKDRYDSIEVGSARTDLADSINGTSRSTVTLQKTNRVFLQEALAQSTKLIQGGLGGHVVFGVDGDGKPNEILIMDTDDKNTAVNVLRINMNGIGFSKNGYEGPFETAWTINGVFNADWINSGTIRAGLIKSGLLQDQKGNNYWNLDTGEFRLKSVEAAQDWEDILEALHKYSDNAADDAQKEAEKKAEDLAKDASDLASAAQKTADSKITTYYQDAAPDEKTLSKGDLWIDVKNNNNLHRWDGDKWVNVTDVGIKNAMEAANTAKATADGKIVTYAQADAPDAASNKLAIGDLWLDTDDNNHPYRWNGSDWVEVRDGFIQEAADKAREDAEKSASDALQKFSAVVQQEVDKKIQVFYSVDEPTADMDSGDLWIDTDDNQMYRYDGTVWKSVQDVQIQTALTNAQTAQETADKKITCTAAATAPNGTTDGDLWIQTADILNDDGTVRTYAGAIWKFSTSDSKWHTYYDKRADALVKNLNDALTQQEVFNRLTNNGADQGIYLEDGKLYINGTYIKAGTITAGLIQTGNLLVGGDNMVSEIDLYSGTDLYGKIDRSGLYINAQFFGKHNFISLKPNIFDGMAIGQNANLTGQATGIAYDGLYVQKPSNGVTLSGFGSDHSTVVKYNGVTVTGESMADILCALTASQGLHIKSTLDKSCVVDTDDYGTRSLYCYEMPSPMFGDIGDGVIAEDGEARIPIDSTFSETISIDQYQVFLQKYGEGECYVSERHSTYFVVKGTAGLQFGWEIKAKQTTYNNRRMETFYASKPEKDDTDYGGLANSYIQSINEGRISSK